MKKISINMISLGRESIYKALDSLVNQKSSHNFEINIILQGTIDLEKIDGGNTNNINVYYYNKGLGFAYYRNQAIEKSTGDILARIDDDERTANTYWLRNITDPIIEGKYDVVTAGTRIELDKGYIADCISYLGYPGGSVLGFDKMRTVTKDGLTKHLCTGNFAFDKKILDTVGGFEESLKSGAEDVAFGTMLANNGISIYREPEATIYHEHRDGIINFCKRHYLRGKSAYQYMSLGHEKMVSGGHWKDKFISIQHILFGNFFTKFMFGIRLLFGLQYLFTIIGYAAAKVGSYRN